MKMWISFVMFGVNGYPYFSTVVSNCTHIKDKSFVIMSHFNPLLRENCPLKTLVVPPQGMLSSPPPPFLRALSTLLFA